MTEGVSASEDAAAARAAEQARIRKERREAKIRAGGSARLNKITGVGGGYQGETDLRHRVEKLMLMRCLQSPRVPHLRLP